MKLGNVEAVKLLLLNSVILEPDKLLVYSIGQNIVDYVWDDSPEQMPQQGSYDMYRYLISLKPIYYMRQQVQRHCSSNYWPYLERDTEEFSRVTLQQLCRTAIREQHRGTSLGDNLRSFHKNILALPLPNLLKDYLLFRS